MSSEENENNCLYHKKSGLSAQERKIKRYIKAKLVKKKIISPKTFSRNAHFASTRGIGVRFSDFRYLKWKGSHSVEVYGREGKSVISVQRDRQLNNDIMFGLHLSGNTWCSPLYCWITSFRGFRKRMQFSYVQFWRLSPSHFILSTDWRKKCARKRRQY